MMALVMIMIMAAVMVMVMMTTTILNLEENAETEGQCDKNEEPRYSKEDPAAHPDTRHKIRVWKEKIIIIIIFIIIIITPRSPSKNPCLRRSSSCECRFQPSTSQRDSLSESKGPPKCLNDVCIAVSCQLTIYLVWVQFSQFNFICICSVACRGRSQL